MIDFGKILADWKAMEAALSSGTIADKLHAAADLVDDAGDAAELFGSGPPKVGAANTTAEAAEIKECIGRIQGCPAPVAAASPVGAWGDGVLLKVILDALTAAFLNWLS